MSPTLRLIAGATLVAQLCACASVETLTDDYETPSPLPRSYLEQFPFDDRWGGLDDYRLRSVILLKAISRVVVLRCGDDDEVIAALRRLTDDKTEGETEVREAARKALETLQMKTE